MPDRATPPTSDSAAISPVGISSQAEQRWGWVCFVAIVAALLMIRGPVMWREPGEMDEDFYAVPGLVILSEGIPKLPHVPGRGEKSIFYHADTVLFAEPPLYFYLQSMFFAVLPPIYGTARLLSLCAGIVLLGLMWTLSRHWFNSMTAAAWATALFSMSRWFFLQVIRARPDVVCTAFGLAGIGMVCQWQKTQQRRWLIIAGLLIGAGGMVHPFAIVYAVQIGIWVIIGSRGWNRLLLPSLVVMASLAVVAAWLPLILAYPEIFQIQFHNQFLSAAPQNKYSLTSRLLSPWESLVFHGDAMWHQIKPWQFVMAVGSLAVCTGLSMRFDRGLRTVCVLALSSTYLLAAMVGTHHHVPGYWTYPASLMFICAGLLIQRGLAWIARTGTPGTWLSWALTISILAAMVPQSRLGTTFVHLRNWNDVNYNGPAFARQIMADIDSKAICVVDAEFLLDFVAAKRNVIVANSNPIYGVQLNPHDYFIASRYAMDTGLVEELSGRLVKTWGDIKNLYACVAMVYVPADGNAGDTPE